MAFNLQDPGRDIDMTGFLKRDDVPTTDITKMPFEGMNNTIGVYIHILFCMTKCPYCDFFNFPFLSSFAMIMP